MLNNSIHLTLALDYRFFTELLYNHFFYKRIFYFYCLHAIINYYYLLHMEKSMKNKFLIMIISSIVLSLSFSGCDNGTTSASLSDKEVAEVANSSVGSSIVLYNIIIDSTQEESLPDPTNGITWTGSGSERIYTFTNYEYTFNESIFEVTGNPTLITSGTTRTFSFIDLKVKSTSLGIDAKLSGSIVIDTENEILQVNYSISGASSITVTTNFTLDYQESSISNAVINNVDYSSQFSTVMNSNY